MHPIRRTCVDARAYALVNAPRVRATERSSFPSGKRAFPRASRSRPDSPRGLIRSEHAMIPMDPLVTRRSCTRMRPGAKQRHLQQLRAWDARRRLTFIEERTSRTGRRHTPPSRRHGADLRHPRRRPSHPFLNQANRRLRVAAHRVAGAAPAPELRFSTFLSPPAICLFSFATLRTMFFRRDALSPRSREKGLPLFTIVVHVDARRGPDAQKPRKNRVKHG